MRRVMALLFVFFGSAGFSFGAPDQPAEAARYNTCLAKAYSSPSVAYEDALIWQNEGGAGPARHCAAMALLGLGDYADAAQKLEDLAYAPDIGSFTLATQVLIQSGEAWLQADKPQDAVRVLSLALKHENDNDGIYTNRARALVALGNTSAAHADLDTALRLNPKNALALRLRAAVLLKEKNLNRARSDIESALRYAPNDVEALLVRGQIREAQRLQ
jgi:tetratricopeptide (TPR) repeat protein